MTPRATIPPRTGSPSGAYVSVPATVGVGGYGGSAVTFVGSVAAGDEFPVAGDYAWTSWGIASGEATYTFAAGLHRHYDGERSRHHSAIRRLMGSA
jgi:hypothetical protein